MQSGHDQAASNPQPRSALARRLLAVLGVLLIVLFAGLGTWQLVRLQWKLDLIARVNARVHAAPVAAPPAAQWAQVTKDSHEYRRVQLSGHYLYEFTTPVQALSSLGAGFWLLTPLCTAEGQLVFINRGFIPAAENRAGRYPARRASAAACATPGEAVTVTGLLRINERGLAHVAPYFVDAGKDQDPQAAPERAVGGLTVISFQNNHLVYALTWYALALMVAGALWWAGRYGSTTTDD